MNDREFYKNKYRERYKPTVKSTLVKTIVFRLISSVSTALLVYLITGSWEATKTMFWIDLVFKSALYYVYEYEWVKVVKWWHKRKKASGIS